MRSEAMGNRTILPNDVSPARKLREHVELVRRLSLSTDPHDLLQTVSTKMGFVMPADHRVTFNRNNVPDGAIRITRSTRWTDSPDPWKDQAQLPIVRGSILNDLLRAARPVKIDQLELRDDDPAYEHLAGMNCLIASPLYHEGAPDYMVVLMRQEPGSFTLDELNSFVLTSNLIGRVTTNLLLNQQLENAYKQLDREFNLVGQIQRGLLPAATPKIPGVSVATFYEPSTKAGGDYYDFFAVPDGGWGFFIADVSGHGPGAAVVMAMMRTLLRVAVERAEIRTSPARLLAYLNERLADSVSPGQFVTAFAGVLYPEERKLVYANAGHNPPRWLRGANSEVVALDGEPTFPLTIAPEIDPQDHVVQAGAGDRFLFYTDGITEAEDPADVQFGTEGLDAALGCCSWSPDSLVQAILSGLRGHVGDQPATDDQTLVALALHG